MKRIDKPSYSLAHISNVQVNNKSLIRALKTATGNNLRATMCSNVRSPLQSQSVLYSQVRLVPHAVQQLVMHPEPVPGSTKQLSAGPMRCHNCPWGFCLTWRSEFFSRPWQNFSNLPVAHLVLLRLTTATAFL